MKLFYFQPDGHGPLSFYVLAESAEKAAEAVSAFAEDRKNGIYDSDFDREICAEMFKEAAPGEVLISENT